MRQLNDQKVSYLDEKQLRLLGYDKTPDFKLDIPIGNDHDEYRKQQISHDANYIFPFLGIEGRVVNWIESKATFGDEETHKNYLNEQLNSYFNRFVNLLFAMHDFVYSLFFYFTYIGLDRV
jgi:hypothetical protein